MSKIDFGPHCVPPKPQNHYGFIPNNGTTEYLHATTPDSTTVREAPEIHYGFGDNHAKSRYCFRIHCIRPIPSGTTEMQNISAATDTTATVSVPITSGSQDMKLLHTSIKEGSEIIPAAIKALS